MSTTSENNKRIAKNTLLLYFRMLFTMGVSLYTSRVVLNTLGVEDFGIYNVVGGVVTMLSFLNGTMTAATQRYITFELGKGNNKGLQKIFSLSISIHILISLLVVILAESIGLWFVSTQMSIPTDRMSAAMWVYQFSILACVVMIMSVPYNAAIIAHEKMSAFAYISIAEVSLKLFIVYLLVIFDFDKLKLYAVLMFAVQLLIRFLYGYYCKRNFSETKYRFLWDSKLFKEMLTFGAWTMNGTVAVLLYTQGINILLNIFFGPVVNAARGIAVQVQNAVASFCYNFQTAVNPQIIKSYAANDLAYMHKLIYATSKYSFFLLYLISLPIIIETKMVLSLWLKTVPEYTVIFVRLMLLICLLEALSRPIIIAAHATGNIKRFQLWEGSCLLSILPFSYCALKLGLKPQSVFIVHLVVAILTQYIRLYIISPQIQMKLAGYFKEVISRVIYVTIISTMFPLLLYSYLLHNILNSFFICFISIMCSLCSIYFWGLKNEERKLIIDKIKKIYKR